VSILTRLKSLKKEDEITPLGDENAYMHPTVLECNLVRLGCGMDVVSDALLEPREAWEGIVKYYESKVK
jgi:hypothetical protein